VDIAKIIKLVMRLLQEKEKLEKRRRPVGDNALQSTEAIESKPDKGNSITQSSTLKKFAIYFCIASVSFLILVLIIIAVAPES
jgi:hypothetical protein